MKIKVIIPASGKGSRFGGDIPKQFQLLKGEPILKHTISVFQNLDFVNEIIIAADFCYTNHITGYNFSKVTQIIQGGETRAESVYAALKAVQSADIVLIHDAARPFVTPETVKAVAEAAKKYSAAIACTQVTDTIKEANHENKIIATPNRTNLWQAQTPQGFNYSLITEAYTKGAKDGILNQVTDDSTLVERLGKDVYIVPSPKNNIKITTAEDMVIAKVLANLV